MLNLTGQSAVKLEMQQFMKKMEAAQKALEKSTPSKSDSQTGSDEYDDQMEMSKSSKEEKPE